MDGEGELLQSIPAQELAPDEVLMHLYDWLESRSLDPYPAQEEAFMEIVAGHHVVLQTPTGSGKSLVAVSCHLHHICRGSRSFYTSPIKALVNEKYRECAFFLAQRMSAC